MATLQAATIKGTLKKTEEYLPELGGEGGKSSDTVSTMALLLASTMENTKKSQVTPYQTQGHTQPSLRGEC